MGNLNYYLYRLIDMEITLQSDRYGKATVIEI